MILKNIFFQINVKDETSDYKHKFYTKSRHICNYIERNCLRPLKFYSDSFQGIGIDLRFGYEAKFMNVEPYISPNKTLVTVLTFDKKRYDNMKTDGEFRDYLYETLMKAFFKLKTDSKYVFPSVEILNCYNELKEKNFINEWLFKRKTDRSKKIVAELYCLMTIEALNLKLKVTQNKDEVFYKKIHEETTNNMVYRQFKDLKIEANRIIVLKSKDKVLKEFSFKELGIKE